MSVYDAEIEELMNPKDELKKKIVTLADTIREWNNESTRVRKTVKEQFIEIRDLGLNKYNMEKTALRRLVEDIFRIHGVSDSYLRKLLPLELKDPSKTRISYLQRQEIEKESQRLLLGRQQTSVSETQHKPENRDYSESDSCLNNLSNYQSAESDISSSSEIRRESEIDQAEYDSKDQERLPSSASNEPIKARNELMDAYGKIEKLEADVRRLSEQFVAKAILQAYTETFPLVAHIDPVKKIITRIGFEKGSGI